MQTALFAQWICLSTRLTIGGTDLCAQLLFLLSRLSLGKEPIFDQLPLKYFDRVTQLHRLQLIRSTIHPLIIRAGMIREALDIAPDKRRPLPRTRLLHGDTSRRCDCFDITAIDSYPLTAI